MTSPNRVGVLDLRRPGARRGDHVGAVSCSGLLTSFTSAHQFATGTPLQLPRPPTLANYADLGDAGFGRAVVVTALMTAVILLGQLTFSVLAAYAFARLRVSPDATCCSGSTSRR